MTSLVEQIPQVESSTVRSRVLAFCYAVTIFVGAFLVFQVQPVVSKTILPWFGGTPAVWTTCMLFFQVLLFCGYLYAHLLTSCLRRTWQGAVHVALLIAAIAVLPLPLTAEWKPTEGDEPTWHILKLLGATVGLPYLLLASTGPLRRPGSAGRFPAGHRIGCTRCRMSGRWRRCSPTRCFSSR